MRPVFQKTIIADPECQPMRSSRFPAPSWSRHQNGTSRHIAIPCLSVHQSAPRELTVKIRHRDAVIELKLLEQSQGEHQDGLVGQLVGRYLVVQQPQNHEVEGVSRSIGSLSIGTPKKSTMPCGAQGTRRQQPEVEMLDVSDQQLSSEAILEDRASQQSA